MSEIFTEKKAYDKYSSCVKLISLSINRINSPYLINVFSLCVKLLMRCEQKIAKL